MSEQPWQVWSIDTDRKRALVVQHGTRAQCEASARIRNASAERLHVTTLRFEALPPGEEPELPEEAGT